MTAPAIEVITIEDEDTERICDARVPVSAPQCSLPARWVGIIKCCGSPRFMCDLHKARRFNYQPPNGVECGACGFINRDFPFAAVERL